MIGCLLNAGVKFDRNVKLTPEQIDHARKLIDRGEARQNELGRSTLYRALNLLPEVV
jgi:hypothetical protein